MKNYKIKLIFLVMAVFITLIFVSCPNQMDSSFVESDLSESSEQGIVYDDPSRGVAVYVDALGVETLIQSEEDSGLVACVELLDYVLFDDPDTASRSAGTQRNFKKALVLGNRNDGQPGLWVVYSGGVVVPVYNDDGLDTSALLEAVEGRQPLSKLFGWTYVALEDPFINGNEIVIIGYAENSGVELHNYSIEKGTTIGVYWVLTEDEEGLFHISRAKVIGLKDRSWWKDYRQTIDKSDYQHRYRWMWALRMFFSGWYDKYLVMPTSVEVNTAIEGAYNIFGTDQDYGTDQGDVLGDTSVAVVTAKRVLSVDKYNDPGTGENRPPYAVVGPDEATFINKYNTTNTVTLETKLPADPDGNSITFGSSPLPDGITLDSINGVITISNPPFPNGDYVEVIFVWTIDEHELPSENFTVTLYLNAPS